MSADARLFTPRFFAMWAFAFMAFFSAFQLLPAIPFRIRELGGSTAAAGSFLSVYTFASALAAPMMGSIADHVGRKRMLVLSSLLFIFFSIGYGVIRWLPLLLIVGMAHGACWSAILASCSAIMSDVIPAARRTEGLAYWGLASNGAVAVAPIVGLFVYHRGWLTLCIELAAISLFMALWAARLWDTEADRVQEAAPPSLRDAWDFRVMRAAASLAVIAFGYGGITSYVAMFSRDRNIHPDSIYFTAFAISIVVVRLLTSRLGDRFGPKAVLYPSLAAIPLSFVILAVAHDRNQLIASAVLFGLAFGSAWPAFASFIVTHTDERRRARTFGSIVGAFDTGIGIGSLTVGAIAEWRGLGTAFLIAAGLSCLSIPIFVAASRSLAPGGTSLAADPEHVTATE